MEKSQYVEFQFSSVQFMKLKMLAPWKKSYDQSSSVQFSCSDILTLCSPMNRSMPGLPEHHQLLELTQTHVHRVSDAIHVTNVSEEALQFLEGKVIL